jgi:hypothetical protein
MITQEQVKDCGKTDHKRNKYLSNGWHDRLGGLGFGQKE